MAIPKCGDEACLDADCDAARAPVSLSQTEKATLLGLVVVLPWLGHASWHAYRDLVTRRQD